MTYCAPIYDEIVRSAGIVILDWKFNPVAQAEVRRAARAYVRGLKRLERDSGDGELARRKLNWLVSSRSSYVCAVIRAARRKKESLSLAELKDRAAGLNGRKAVGEPVRVRLKAKSSGGHRAYVIAGPLRTALQVLGRDLLSALHPAPANEFAARGRDHHAAVSTVIAELNDSGSHHLVLGDIEAFFASVSPGHLRGLVHLPAAMQRVMFFIEEGAPIEITQPKKLDIDIKELNQTVRSGLPQGSLASPSAAALVMANLMSDVAAKPALTFVDDFVFHASSAKEAETIKCALHSRFQTHPAGPLVFKRLERVSLPSSFKPIPFLGYVLKWGLNGQARAKPCPAAFRKFRERLAKQLMATPLNILKAVALSRAEEWMKLQRAADWNETAVDIMVGQAMKLVQKEMGLRKHLPMYAQQLC